MENSKLGFVPPGHARIIPFRVICAWLHEETGAWLSTQCMGPAVAVVWRASDSYAATPHLISVVCETLNGDENFRIACELAKVFLSEGPPPELMASAKRSAEARIQKAKEAANARWGRQRKEAKAD